MPGANVPQAGELGGNSNTNLEQEELFENQAEAIRRIPGVGFNDGQNGAYQIVSGVLSPTEGVGRVLVAAEGGATNDGLDSISGEHYRFGSLIILRKFNPGENITVNHRAGGVEQITTSGGLDFALTDGVSMVLEFRAFVGWVEIARLFGDQIPAFRDYLGLGSAATLDNGTLDAASFAGLPPSAFLGASSQAIDSARLGGQLVTEFIRSGVGGEQSIDSPFVTGQSLTISTPSPAVASQFIHEIAGVPRSQTIMDPIQDESRWELISDDGSSLVAGVRIREDGSVEFFDPVSSSWQSLTELPPLPPSSALHGIQKFVIEDDVVLNNSERVTLYSELLPTAPWSGATRTFEISASFLINDFLTSGVDANMAIYAGQGGNDTDALIDDVPLVPQEREDREYVYVAAPGDILTLIARTGVNQNVPVIHGATGSVPGRRIENNFIRFQQIS